MIKLKIDNQAIAIKEGSTLLQAAQMIGVRIPTMCHREGHTPYTSCMICIVKDKTGNRLLPSCSTRVEEGMVIETDSDEVRQSRKTALELLLSDHVGDCEGPCSVACPAHMNIPQMLDHIEAGRFRDALITVKEHIPLPAVLGRICPAPCEKACRRSQVDSPVAVCLLKRYVADLDLHNNPFVPECKRKTGRKVAVIGSGPAGLSAAYYLLREGHACTLFEAHGEPGGMLRYGVPEIRLPRSILDAEIDIVRRMGADFRMQTKVGENVPPEDLKKKYDAVILTTGRKENASTSLFGETIADGSIRIDRHTHETTQSGVFAGGGCVRELRMAVTAVAQGRSLALSVSRYLHGADGAGSQSRFNSRIGKLRDGEADKVLAFSKHVRENLPTPDLSDQPGPENDISSAKAASEASRCLHCECLKPDDCLLRQFADEYGAAPHLFKGEERNAIEKTFDHPHVVHETGKCIKCGLCVRITENHGDALGLTFIGRGFDVRIGTPLNQTLDKALRKIAARCVEACPTGALAFRADYRRNN